MPSLTLSRASRNIDSEYILNNSGDQTQPYFTHCSIDISTVSFSAMRTADV